MIVPVGVLAVLAVVGGWLQVAGVWHPFGEWLDPIAFGREHLALVEPTVDAGLGHERDRRRPRDASGSAVAWVLYGARTRPVPRVAAVQRALEHKFWFDELYDASSTGPPSCLARLLRARGRGAADRRLDLRRHARRPRGGRRGRRGADRLPAHLRARDRRLRSPSSSSSSSPSNDDRADRPPARRRARRLAAAAARARGRCARAARRARRGRALGGRRRPASTSTRACSCRTSTAGSATSASPTTSASTASRSGSSASPSSSPRPRSATRCGRTASAAARYHGLLLFLTGSIVGVFTAQDLLALLRLLRGDADPDLRPDRRLGRAAADARDRDVRHLHDGRLAADARLDRRLRALAGDVLARRLRASRRTSGSSSASSSPSR